MDIILSRVCRSIARAHREIAARYMAGKCKISLVTRRACAAARCSDKRLAELSLLTKEKLHHYLAFECPIREIAAVSDRHCLPTDSPRYMHAALPLLLHRFTRRCVLFAPLVFCPPLFLSSSHSCILYCFYEPPLYCIQSLSYRGSRARFAHLYFFSFLPRSRYPLPRRLLTSSAHGYDVVMMLLILANYAIMYM